MFAHWQWASRLLQIAITKSVMEFLSSKEMQIWRRGSCTPSLVYWPKEDCEGGDLLISVRAPIGAVNMAVERCCIGRGVAAIHPNDDSISVDFLKHQLLSKRRELETMGTGSTFKAVGKKSLGNLTLVLYPEDTQHEIERCLNQIKNKLKQYHPKFQAWFSRQIPVCRNVRRS